MSLYEFLLFVHILMAVTWVGGGIAIQVLANRATRAKDPVRTAAVSADAEWMGLRVFMPASILLLVSGIWAASEGNWDFGQAWISIGFAAFLFSFFLGMTFLGPESGRIKQLVRERSYEDPEVQRRIGRILLFSRIELVVLLVAIWAMVAKPGL
jgi:uncharacterized membrane protein